MGGWGGRCGVGVAPDLLRPVHGLVVPDAVLGEAAVAAVVVVRPGRLQVGVVAQVVGVPPAAVGDVVVAGRAQRGQDDHAHDQR